MATLALMNLHWTFLGITYPLLGPSPTMQASPIAPSPNVPGEGTRLQAPTRTATLLLLHTRTASTTTNSPSPNNTAAMTMFVRLPTI